MKIIFTLISCLFIILVNSQEIESITLLAPESKELQDLSFLKEELEGKKLIMLGELTHMYGNIFEMKARVIEYLHQYLGFTTIAMESSMYDLWKMNKNGFNKKTFNNSIWGVWASSLEFQRLVNYIDENHLKVVGFDSQVNNTSKFIEDFFDYCDDQNIELKLDEDDFGIIIEGVLENLNIEEDDIEYLVYEKEVKRIIEQIQELYPNETNYYWKQFTKSLLATSRDAYFNKKEILTTNFVNKNHNIRDKQMADNLLSYINRHPNEKIICWADNIHIMNNNSSTENPIAKAFISMGTHIKKTLKSKAYSLATIHANDSLFDSGTKKWHMTPIANDSFENELDNLDQPYLFVTSNQDVMRLKKKTRLLNFIDFGKEQLDQLHDGYIFFQKATLPKRETETIIITKNIPDLDEKTQQVEVGQKITLRGQILDKENNEPIPFATLILKNEEIYRVADENGFYELPVKKSMMQNTSVIISSMGFEPRSILLKALHDKTHLKPKFEALGEVILTSKLSPKAVLKKAVFKKMLNHPVEPFNFYRYGKVLINKNDKDELDLELVTKDYDDGYLSPFVITQRVEQIKWNKNNNPKRYIRSAQFYPYRQNAIRYATILHKRKYKKFKVTFVKSDNSEDDDSYIISFETERNKWNYTNRGYPTKYSGSVYIDRESFAILKVIENWETTLRTEEITKYLDGNEDYNDIIQTTIKEENICVYSKINGNGKYYATKYFNRSYHETLDKEDKKKHHVFERNSYLYDFKLTNVEAIEYFQYNNKKENSLFRVDYDNLFWDTFYTRKIGENQFLRK